MLRPSRIPLLQPLALLPLSLLLLLLPALRMHPLRTKSPAQGSESWQLRAVSGSPDLMLHLCCARVACCAAVQLESPAVVLKGARLTSTTAPAGGMQGTQSEEKPHGLLE
jgi:hypothetical protein